MGEVVEWQDTVECRKGAYSIIRGGGGGVWERAKYRGVAKHSESATSCPVGSRQHTNITEGETTNRQTDREAPEHNVGSSEHVQTSCTT